MSKPSAIEGIKIASDGLRGSINESLKDEITGAIREDDKAVIKFHGMYEQDDRDRREERAEKKLDRLYSFMIRLRLPGGFLPPEKWIAMNNAADEHSTGVIKITTRQTVQLHGILKSHIKPTISSFNEANLDSIATCGDINRNVTCASHPKQSAVHAEVFAYADKISQLLMPKTKAYYEIWLDEEKIVDKKEEEDPLYLDKYLPRKFKIGIAIPPNNDSDVFTNDLGLIAIIENNELKGFNVAVGGGLSTTHGNAETYARLATVIGYAPLDKVLKVVYEVVTTQRDFGNRSDRKLARLKYTVDRMGIDHFKAEVEKRCGFTLDDTKPYTFTTRSDYYGWHQGENNLWYYTVFVENGRVLDDEKLAMKTALLEIAKTGKCNFLFTATQNVIVADVKEEDKAAIQLLLEQFKIIEHTEGASLIKKNSIACVALPTCPLALAEAQRYLPSLLEKIEPLTKRYGIDDENIVIRMTGCPNGCGRPYAAEIGFVGTGPGLYNLHIGGDNQGERLNIKYKDSLDEKNILTTLEGLFAVYKNERVKGERFGDFVMRRQLV
ncbi:MAG TPA: NADPH-dependent assimilatory sulfite reductase hemoprotein subunit [Ferruginibacter sp.]|nr:NADPH-dependent assimilatory sulfite reductase hemoprotein subunit [Ferruginibacter sp.]HPH89654.1 NADPH-dependent assimilatory sulfite reductase hemoprotein subunit [Ferruginibacter sp.]